MNKEYKVDNLIPVASEFLKVFKLTNPDDIKVVIIGQAPYPDKRFADGIAFSSKTNQPLPGSLRNIFKELEGDLGISHFNNPCLSNWVKQGVFLINSSWVHQITERNKLLNKLLIKFFVSLIQYLNQNTEVLFVFFGKKAATYQKYLVKNTPTVVTAHPSPLSFYRGFKKSCVFTKINNLIDKKIDWSK